MPSKIWEEPGGILYGGTIYEEVLRGDQYLFAVKKPKTEKIEIRANIRPHGSEKVQYEPLKPCPWVLPPPPQNYGDLKQLYNYVRTFIYQHVDFEYDVEYDVCASWILASWTPERWDTCGYLWFTGPKNSGKSRALEVLKWIGYRPLLSASVSASSIYRAIDQYQPTFLLDEFEMYQKMKEVKAEIIGVLNAGYRKGQLVLRTDKVRDGKPTLKGFKVFGFKAVASILDLPSATRSRTIPIIMSRATRKVKYVIDKEQAAIIRSYLLQYRFDHVFLPPPVGNPLDLPDGRLIEKYVSLVSVAPSDVEEALLNHARKTYKEELEEERDTREAKVFLAIVDLLAEMPRTQIPQPDIRDKVNTRLPEKKQMTPQYLGKILRSLGFTSIEGEHRLKEAIMSPKVLKRRAQRYLTSEEKKILEDSLSKIITLETSDTSET